MAVKKNSDLNEESQLNLMRQELAKTNARFDEFQQKIGPLSTTELDTSKVFQNCLEASIGAMLNQTPLNILMSARKSAERSEQIEQAVKLAVALHEEIMRLYYKR